MLARCLSPALSPPMSSTSPRRRTTSCFAAGAAVAAPPKRESDPRKRVVITGMGLVSAFGNDVDAFYDKLLAGESAVVPIDKFDASPYPTQFGAQIRGFTTEGLIDDGDLKDPVRYALFSGTKAVAGAGIPLGSAAMEKIDKLRAGVVIGSGLGSFDDLDDTIRLYREKGISNASPRFMQDTFLNASSALVAMHLGFMGPAYSINSACATSNCCIHAAANHIRSGKCDVMLAGGTEAPFAPAGFCGFVALRALSQRNDDPATASRPWDRARDGFVMGEGAGILVMESLEHAARRGAPIVAEYLGGAINCDAHHVTEPRPDGHGVSSCIKMSLAAAGVALEEVNYINAHATSTVAGDLAEAYAIQEVFRDDLSRIKVNATKSMIGHCLGAAGGLEAIATLKAITTGWLHPTANQFDLERAVEFDTVANEKQQLEINVAISNSFGFGGHNAVLVFAPFRP